MFKSLVFFFAVLAVVLALANVAKAIVVNPFSKASAVLDKVALPGR